MRQRLRELIRSLWGTGPREQPVPRPVRPSNYAARIDATAEGRCVRIWSADGLTVTAWMRGHDGALMLDGDFFLRCQVTGPDGTPQSGVSQYEYTLTVAAPDVETVRRALLALDSADPAAGAEGIPAADPAAVPEGADEVLALLRRYAAVIVGAGESTWLRSIGVEPDLWVHS